MSTWLLRLRNAICVSILLTPGIAGLGIAEEPTKLFLERLRDDRLYDVALKYLEISEKRNRLPASLQEDLQLEKVILLQQSISMLPTTSAREERIGQVEQELQAFLKSAPSHPRRSEAQTRFGDLLRDRAMLAIGQSKKTDNAEQASQHRTEARKRLDEAGKLYTEIIEELTPILQNLAGNRAQTPAEVERRARLQNDYRQAEILRAKSIELTADTYDENAPEWRTSLESAEASLKKIIDQMSTSRQEAGRRTLCQLYLAHIQVRLKKLKDARESFTRVESIKEAGVFRLWCSEATAGLIRIDLAETPPKYEAAIQRGDEWLKALTNQERVDPTGIDLQLAIADARIAFSKSLDPSKNGAVVRNSQREARSILLDILKINGPHKDAATKSLAELGVEAKPDSDATLPEAKNFEEATQQARMRLERAENAEQTIPLLQQQNVVQEDIDKVKLDIQNDRDQAIERYLLAIRMYKEADGREALLEAKYYLSYLYLKTEKYWESYAVASSVVESDKNTTNAPKCGEFALIALSRLLDAAPQAEQSQLVPTLEKLAKLLLEIAPGTSESRAAVDVLVRLSVREKRYADAERYVELAGENSSGSASLVGQMLWQDYQTRMAEHRSHNGEETEEDRQVLNKAESLLKSSWDNLNPDRVDLVAYHGINTLASIYLSKDRVDEALALIREPSKGSIAIVEKSPQFESKEKLEAYRVLLQALVQQAGQPGGKSMDSGEISTLVNRMKSLAGGDDALLGNALRSLAFSISSKVSQSKDPADQARMGGALGLLVQQLVEVTSDISILDSAGNAVFVLATNLQKVPGLSAQAKSLMQVADAAYTKIAAKPDAELDEVNRKREDLQMRIAIAKAGAGQFEAAHKVFAETLAKNPMNVAVQIAAARNLQEWSDGKDIELLRKAWGGAEPGANGANSIWGWNRIGQLTASRVSDENFREIYFDARYNLALCRRLIGLAQTNADARKRELTQAAGIVRQTRIVYPNFGSPQIKAKFEQLDEDLKKDLGTP